MRKPAITLLGMSLLIVGCSTWEATKRIKDVAAQNRVPPIAPPGAAGFGTLPPAAGKALAIQVRALPPGGSPGDQRGESRGVGRAAVWIKGMEVTSTTGEDGKARIVVPPGERTLVVSPLDGQALKESTYRITVSEQGEDTYTFYVSPDRELFFDDGQEVAPPSFNPEPERLSEIAELSGRGRTPFLARQGSVWRDGEVQVQGLFHPFFVWTPRADESVIGTHGGVRDRWFATYRSPQAIGRLTITGIDESGMVVSFTSSTGVTGTFNLHTHGWSFAQR